MRQVAFGLLLRIGMKEIIAFVLTSMLLLWKQGLYYKPTLHRSLLFRKQRQQVTGHRLYIKLYTDDDWLDQPNVKFIVRF